MMEQARLEIEKLLKLAGIKCEIELSVPPQPEMGDVAFACFGIAKEEKKNPVEVAKELAKKCSDKIGKNKILSAVMSAGPYVNFSLNAGEVAKLVITKIKKDGKKYGINKNGKNQKVLLEYPSNNTHKELHVGHLRNICIGNVLTKIFEANGYKALPINYVNDYGTHVAKCLWGLKKFHNKEEPPKGAEQKWLGQIYAEASQYLAEHLDSKLEVEKIQTTLEARNKSIWPLFLRTRKWSLEGFKKVFTELKVKHAKVFYEKDVKSAGQKMVDKLVKNKIAQIGEGGAIIVDLKQFNLDIGLLRKSNGAGLYLTSDLGLAVAKKKAFSKTAENIHITGTEQNFYFKQLFKILELAGYKYKTTHIGYGLVNRPEGKMSSRLGNVILYDEIRNEVYEQVFQETALRHPDWPKEKLIATASDIAFAAIKFDLLKHEAAKIIVFDAESATSFDGFTGPYVLYVIARIGSILKKAKAENKEAKKDKADYSLLIQPVEKQVLLLLGQFGKAITKALIYYNPSVITKYSFDLAKQFNDFYHQCSVLKADSENLKMARLELLAAVRQVLKNCMDLLTIASVEEM